MIKINNKKPLLQVAIWKKQRLESLKEFMFS